MLWQDQSKGGRHDLPCDLKSEKASTAPICLPNQSESALSKITIFYHGDQRLKLTVYYSTSKILIQGKSCATWVSDEFKTLKALVDALYAQNAGRAAAIQAIESIPCLSHFNNCFQQICHHQQLLPVIATTQLHFAQPTQALSPTIKPM